MQVIHPDKHERASLRKMIKSVILGRKRRNCIISSEFGFKFEVNQLVITSKSLKKNDSVVLVFSFYNGNFFYPMCI